MDLRGKWVHFRISDLYLPEPKEVLHELYGNDLLQGKVIQLSDSGTQPTVFAVVKVEGIDRPVIVPIDRILGVL